MRSAIQITMLRVGSYGSVLQAFALQKAICSIKGWTCQTLDVVDYGRRSDVSNANDRGPGKFNALRIRLQKLSAGGWRVLFERALSMWNRKFWYKKWFNQLEEFIKNEIVTTRKYLNEGDLALEPPVADLYITGSDQSLNPTYTNGASTWFFSFLSNVDWKYCKISYASSFTARALDQKYQQIYVKGLSNYDALSFRENSGVKLAESLGLRGATHCCDPTLLFNHEFWRSFAASGKHRHRIHTPYILCYNVRYLVDPCPLALKVENLVANALHLPIVYLWGGGWRDQYSMRGICLKDATPYEFVDLFLNADFILTSSYHGTAFALQSGKPFLTYVKDDASDSRVVDLLEKCGAQKHVFRLEEQSLRGFDCAHYSSSRQEQSNLETFRVASWQWLREKLIKAEESLRA